MFKMKLLSSFQLAMQILTFHPIKVNFIYEIIRRYLRILFLEPAVKAKMLMFVLPTEKRNSFIFDNQGELERTEITKIFC